MLRFDANQEGRTARPRSTDRKHDLPWLVRRPCEHLVRAPGLFQWQDRTYARGDSPALEHLREHTQPCRRHFGVEEDRFNTGPLRRWMLGHHGDELPARL